jgi:hypothetical protein
MTDKVGKIVVGQHKSQYNSILVQMYRWNIHALLLNQVEEIHLIVKNIQIKKIQCHPPTLMSPDPEVIQMILRFVLQIQDSDFL